MEIKPTKENLKEWIDIYVPETDLFFIKGELLSKGIDISEVILMPKDEFFNHSTFSQINFVNSYLYWNIKNIEYVIIAEKNWIVNLPLEEKKMILNSQVRCKRGLVIPTKFVNDLTTVPSDYIVNDHIIIQRAMWEKLNNANKEQMLSTMVYEWWDNGKCEIPPDSMPRFMEPFANTFSNKQGANCLAAVLFAVTEGRQKWFISEWIHQQTFIEALKNNSYDVVSDDNILVNDVIVWLDTNGIIQHAAFHIGDDFYFNKDGQTIFNPWKILKKEQLFKDWEHLTPIIYRCYKD